MQRSEKIKAFSQIRTLMKFHTQQLAGLVKFMTLMTYIVTAWLTWLDSACTQTNVLDQCTRSVDIASASSLMSPIFLGCRPSDFSSLFLVYLVPFKLSNLQLHSLLQYSPVVLLSKHVTEPSTPSFLNYVYNFCWPAHVRTSTFVSLINHHHHQQEKFVECLLNKNSYKVNKIK